MKKGMFFLVFILTLAGLPLAWAVDSPVGTWTTIDDHTGKKRALVQLSIADGTLSGTLVQVFQQAGDTGICSLCPGEFKDKKIEGLRFLWGLKDEGNGVWGGGSILDPKSGKIYKAKITLEGDKLYVRGYLGISLLGRTQTWLKQGQQN